MIFFHCPLAFLTVVVCYVGIFCLTSTLNQVSNNN